jgi:hypothetical protein
MLRILFGNDPVIFYLSIMKYWVLVALRAPDFLGSLSSKQRGDLRGPSRPRPSVLYILLPPGEIKYIQYREIREKTSVWEKNPQSNKQRYLGTD